MGKEKKTSVLIGILTLSLLCGRDLALAAHDCISSAFFPFSFQGDWVWLKKFPPGDFGDIKSIKSSASDVFEMV